MKTRDRILAASQELFNRHGERAVSTNHIAAHLGISPGNLYYHFDNKLEIIRELSERHLSIVYEMLTLPEDRSFTMEDKALLMERLFNCLWDYQFIYRDQEHMLSEDPELADLHQQAFRHYLQLSMNLHAAMEQAGLQKTTQQQQRDLALNAWLVATNWVSFVRCNIYTDQSSELPQPLIKRGIYQVLTLEKAYMTATALNQFEALEQDYYCDIDSYIKISERQT